MREEGRVGSPLFVYLPVGALWQRGGNTEVGTWCPLRPVPIPRTAITYNNDGLMVPVGDLTSARKREEQAPRGRYEGVYVYTDIEMLSLFLHLLASFSSFAGLFPARSLSPFLQPLVLSLILFCLLAFH